MDELLERSRVKQKEIHKIFAQSNGQLGEFQKRTEKVETRWKEKEETYATNIENKMVMMYTKNISKL